MDNPAPPGRDTIVPTTAPIGVGPTPMADPNAARKATAARRRKRSIKDGLMLLGLRLALGAVIVALWQLTVEFEILDPTVTSNPGDVASFLWNALGTSVLWTNLEATITAMVLAFLLASVVGVVVGISLALLPRFERIVSPYLDALNSMPRIALAPVFVVGFGLTINAKIALAFSIVVFIVITAARAGVRSVDVDIMRLATVLGANRRQMFTKVLFPVAVPSIFGGLRLGVIYSLLGVVTAELIASREGMGQLLQEYASLFQIDGVYALLIVLALVASVLNAGMAALEKHLLRWQAPDERHQ
jgi:NitT/TauT family transport system permease protein